jgi:hypothetical protein
MTTRNFRVKNGLEVGDVTIDSSTNKITGLSTSTPSDPGDVATKAYVDAQVTASDLDFQADSGGALAIDLDSETLTFTGGTGIDTSGSGNAVTFAIDSTVATLSGSQTLTNKILTSAVLNTGVSGTAILDEDDLSSNSDTQLATQQSIKAYVDNGLSSLSSTTITEGNSSVDVDDGAGGAGQVIINVDGNNELVINDTDATFSGNVIMSGNLTVNGTTTTVNSTNTTLDDNLLELNSGAASNANDSGFIIERGSTGDNAIFMWDESADKFTLGTTTATASSTGNISVTAGTLVAATFEGDLTGTATAAEYSDVAERFAADTAYEPGTVVALGGAAEITAVNEEASDEVFGVISSLQQAAFKMNGGAGNDETHPYIAMTGRVNVKVIGTVNKGDRLISASVPGYAKAATKAECTAFNVIGRALTSKTESGQGSVLAAVRVSH